MRLLKTLLSEAGTDFKKVKGVLTNPFSIMFYGIVLWCLGLFGITTIAIDHIGVGPQHVLPPMFAYIAFTGAVFWFIKLLRRSKERIRKENKDTMDALSGRNNIAKDRVNDLNKHGVPYHAGSREVI